MNQQEILEKALEFHGHRCWASVAGVRVGEHLQYLGLRLKLRGIQF